MTNTAVTELKQPEAPVIADSTMSEIMLNTELLAGIQSLAKSMSQAKVTIPKHLSDSPADCYAVILQAIQWKMNPFAVAQKTHVINGTLGYEAQLVNAVIQRSGAIVGHFHYEYRGEGNALECRVGAILKGESGITWGEWLSFASVTVKNSPLWKTNPRQQLGYLQVKNFGRLYTPGAILGVYTPDELQDQPIQEREIGPKASDLNEMLKAKPAPAVVERAEEAEIVEEEYDDPTPTLTYADIAEQLNTASTPADLQVAVKALADFCATGDNDQFKDELGQLYRARLKQLKAIADELKQ